MILQCECEVPMSEKDEMSTDYLAYHAVVGHFDQTRGFKDVQDLQDSIWRWLNFYTDADKSAKGQVLLRKHTNFPDYLANFKLNYKLDEVILWVISCILREPIAVLLKDEFWITTVDLEIANIDILFAYGVGGRPLSANSLH